MIILEITLEGHFLVAGGRSSNLGIDLSTAQRFDNGRWIPYIPATAVRGAVRIQLEALLRGARQEATGPYPLDAEGAEEPAGDAVSRLFGYSGPEGERAGSREGLLRFSDALPVDPDRVQRSVGVRTGVEIDDATASAEDKKLFSRELLEHGEPVVFRCRLDVERKADSKDVARLRAGVETTAAIGAGKSAGGGQVRIEWLEEAAEVENRVVGIPAKATRAWVLCTLREPVHFGDGGPRGNHHGTRTYLPGSTLRGAIAWALLRHSEAQAEDESFKRLFLGPESASFGDGWVSEDLEAEPRLYPATARELRESDKGRLLEDILVRELARSEVNDLLQGRNFYLRSDVGHLRPDPLPARSAAGLMRRVRTRVSIDRHTGASADGKLFSIEQIEAWTAGDASTSEPVRFAAWIEGLTPPAAQLLAKIEGVPVYVGAGRNHGMGSVALEVHLREEPDIAADVEIARQKVQTFSEAVETSRSAMAKRCGVATNAESEAPLYMALVARSEYLPAGDFSHPLAFCQHLSGKPVRSFLASGHSGGYNQMPGNEQQPLKTLRMAIGAGSVFVYQPAKTTLAELLQQALPRLRSGIGERRESGCGRFDLFEEVTT